MKSDMKQYCIFCTTPFQIMTAVHLTLMEEKEAEVDLYIVDQFAQADRLSERIEETGIFRHVITVYEKEIIDKSNQSKPIIWSRITASYLQLNKVARKILKDNYKVPYDSMYLSSRAFISRVVALYYAKNKFNTKIIYFDDGLGSYYDKNILYPRFSDQVFRYFLLGRRASAVNPKKLLLYDPQLLRTAGVINEHDVDVEAIPKWEQTSGFVEIMNNIFAYSEDDTLETPIIIFDGLYTGNKRQMMDSFYEKVVGVAGAENVIVKKHPRDKAAETEGLHYYHRFDLPFELLCLNTKMEEKLLIALSTTAIITPRLLFNEEPYVLALDKIQEMAEETPQVQYSDFKAMYTRKYRFFEAENEAYALKFVKEFCIQSI